ncbi:MAG: InlB B-repeat-containing protein, partial [Bacilli bacterium]|nr:InlB B-repeat-containing protein [Bacilli bacterium]
TYINKAIANGEDYKYVAYYLNNQIYREEYVIANEKIENINPGVEKFAGWYTDKKYTNRYDFENEVTKDLILFGKINDNKYTVTFIDVNPNNGAETILDIVEVNEGESVDLIDHPEYRGYTFKCFELNNACYQDEEIIEDTELYTSYKINTYDIVYNLDDGELESGKTNPDTYTVRDTFTLNNPSKEGFTFTGWSGTDLSEKTITVTIPKGSIGDREYTANYEKIKSTLTIDPNGGTYRNNASTVSYTEEYGTVKQVEDSVRRGYEFLGYKHDGGGIYSSGSYTFDNEDGLLTAQYDIITYSISYENITPEERAFLDNPISYNVETETFTLKNPNTRVDYLGNPIEDFLGWDDGNGNVSLTVTIPKGSTGDRTYTAVWGENQNSYSITYELHDGEYETGKTNPSTYTRQTETFTLNNPGKDGYNFTGWSGTELIGTENTTVTITKGSAGNRAYEAHYTVIPYTISYENITPEERAFLDNPISYNIETETFTLKNPNTRVDDQGNNYQDFLGWNDGNGNTSLTVTIPKGSIGNRTYTAVWRENEDDYAITYELHGGELASGKSNPSTYTRQTPTFTLNNPGKLGYTFKGWSGTELTGTENTTVTIAKGSAGDRAYEANYTLIPYTISYDNITPEERTFLDNPIEYNIETETFTLKNPNTRVDNQGYNYQDFLGWDDGDGNVSLTVTIPKGSTGNRVYTAVWRENQDIYDITYELHGGEYETGKTNPNSYTRQTETFTLNNPGKTGYTFKGWSGTGLTGIENTTVTIPVGSAGDRAYEANYQVITYSITYDYDDGVLPAGVTNPTEYTIESDTINIANPSKEGYEFLGWSGTDIADKSTSVIIPHGSTGDRVYTANFKKIEYSLTYTLNGGHYKAGESNPDKYTVESPDITLNNPEKDGYTFKGWSGTDLTGDENTTVTIPHGSMGHRSFLANYIPIPYSITYDYDGGSLPIGVTNPSTYTIETEDITFNTPSKEGYTFLNYTIENVITTGIPKGSIGDKHVVAHYEIEHYKVTYYNDSDKFAEVPVDWNELTTEISAIPTKAHNIFLRWSEGRYWLDEDTTAFDFANTYIRENRTLYAVYEEVLPPVITLNPTLDDTTNRTWVCGDETNDTCGVTVTIENNPALTDTTGYSIYYKVGDGAATLYTGPFPVYSNETITAFAEKSNISSENTTADIVNVDTIAPTINQPSTGSMSFNITVRGVAQDASSGVKKFTLYVKEKDALVFDDILTYTSEIFDGIKDHSENYDHTFAVKHDDTEYIVKIVAEDYVGNISEREVEVKTNPYVARVVGKNGILWYTVDPDTKEFVFSTPFLPFDSIQMAIDYCAEMQCTIQTNPIYSTVNESVTIGDNQNITIDLDGRNISSDENSTFVNNGELHIVDRNPRLNGTEHESIGKVINTTGKTIINNGHFILGDGSAEPSETFIYPELDRPIIQGYQAAIEQNNTFYFFDGKLVSDGLVALIDNGEDPITQYSYNVVFTGENEKRIGTLAKVDDPEARIKSTYYTKLKIDDGSNAFDSTKKGTITTEDAILLSKIRQVGDYGFVYDEVNDEIYNGNSSTANTTALSYLKLDFTNETEGKFVIFDTYIDSYNSNSIGYVYVSEELGNTGTEIFRTTGNDATGTKLYYLEKGKVYYIYFKYVKVGGDINSYEKFKITNLKLLGQRESSSELTVYEDQNYYQFVKQPDGSIMNANSGASWDYQGTIAHTYSIYDLRNETDDINLIINLDAFKDPNGGYSAWIYTSNNPIFQNYNVDTNRHVFYENTNLSNKSVIIPLKHGELNYVHFGFRQNYRWGYGESYFKINSISLSKTKSEDLIPISSMTNDGTYYFEKVDYDPLTWKDLSNNHANVDMHYSQYDSQNKGFKFLGNSYGVVDNTNFNFTDYEETVYLEYSTTVVSNNSVMYMGSTGEKISIGVASGCILVSNDSSVRTTFAKPSNFEDGNKHSILVSYKDGQFNLYFDGETLEGGSKTDYFGGATASTRLGAKNQNSASYFNGTIYKVKVFNKEIHLDELNNTDNLLLYLDGEDALVPVDNMYISNNYTKRNTTAHSYLTYDLTNINEDKYLYVNIAISSQNNYDFGYVQLTDSPDLPSNTNNRNRITGEVDNSVSIFKLEKNKINYIHFVYFKNDDSINAGYDMLFIKEIKYFNTLEDAYSISSDSFNKNNIFYFEKPIFNEKVDTIEILKNITLNTPIVVPQEKEVILDLNGFTLTSSKNDYIIKNNGKLTIIDSEFQDRHKLNVDYETEQSILYNEARNEYLADLAEYEEYAGLCDGCSPSEEYVIDSTYTYDYSYIDDYDTFVAPYTGTYSIEAWGSQGNDFNTTTGLGGKGAYVKGEINLNKDDVLYVYVGGQGSEFNGGGRKGNQYKEGGGASDVRLVSGSWDDSESLASRIMVAGSGGGGHSYAGGAGGALKGIDGWNGSYGNHGGKGGTQISGGERGYGGAYIGSDGSFGKGGSAPYFSSGGGSGYYGGGSSGTDTNEGGAGGGGSSYISGYKGCVAISDATNTAPRLDSNNALCTEESALNDIECSYHYSGMVFDNTEMKSGLEVIQKYDGSYSRGNSGDGHVKIKALSTEEIDALKENLEKTYSVKSKPLFSSYLDGINFDDSFITEDNIISLTPNEEPIYPIIIDDTYHGAITTTIDNAVLNEQYAILTIDGASINVSVNSRSGIQNRGLLIFKGDAEINANNNSSIGIFNESNGTIEEFKGVLNAKGNSSIGLLNRSNTTELNEVTAVTSNTSAIGIENQAIDDVTFTNIKVTGSGIGFRELGQGNTVILNSNFKSTGSNSFQNGAQPERTKLTINNSSFSGQVLTDDSAKIVTFNNSKVSSLINIYGNIIINRSDFGNLDNRGEAVVNNSNFSTSGNVIMNYAQQGKDVNPKLLIKNSIINSTATATNVEVVTNNGFITLDNTSINNIYNTKSVAINNATGTNWYSWPAETPYLNIKGNVNIDSSFGTAIKNTGVVTLGTKESNIGTVYEYGYTGFQEEFTAPEDGVYKLETWGASGSQRTISGGNQAKGGRGGYASGTIELHQGDKLYVHVGGAGVAGTRPSISPAQPSTVTSGLRAYFGSYNGGGALTGTAGGIGVSEGAGGGATDISLSNEDNTWSYDNGIVINKRSQASYEQRLVVAGGGSSNSNMGLSAYGGYNIDPSTSQLGYGNRSGGGGYYGGSNEYGGSSYVSDTLSNAILIGGNAEMPDYSSSGFIKGNYGSGYAKITLLNDSEDVVTNTPNISATDYGIIGSGRIIYYDGTITAKNAIISDIDLVPTDYDIYISKDSNEVEKAVLVPNANSRPVEAGEEEYVAQIGQAKYTTIQRAIDASNNGDEIDLLVDIKQQNTINVPADKQVTIDYNGHTVKSYNNNYLYKNYGNLTITDSKNILNNNIYYGDYFLYNEGTLSVNNIYTGNTNWSEGIIRNNEGTITMNGVKLDFGNIEVNNKNAITNTENGSITVSNSIMNLIRENYFFSNEGSLTLTGNTILNGYYGRHFIDNNNLGNVVLDDNSYTVSDTPGYIHLGYGRYLLVNNDASTVATIKNMTTLIENVYNAGDLTLEGNNIPSGTISNKESGIVRINSGTYNNTFENSSEGRTIDNTDNLYSFIMHDGIVNTTLNRTGTGTFNIEGGTIDVSSGYAIDNRATGTINLGIHDGNVLSKENTKPIITGESYGIYTNTPIVDVNFYDGIVTGQKAYNTNIKDIETGYSVHLDYDSDNDIETKYLSIEPIFTNDTQGTNYSSIDELNNAIADGLVNNNDVIKAYRNMTIIKDEDSILIPSGLKLTFDINGKKIDKNNNIMFTINGELDVIDSVNDSIGYIDSIVGTLFENNGTLNIISGTYNSEQDVNEVEVVRNNENATLNISGGTLKKIYDRVDYRQRNTGSIINNSGIANVTGGKFIANGSFVEYYWRRGTANWSDYIYTSSVFDNKETGVLTVTGGNYDGVSSQTWYDYASEFKTYSTTNKGELIYNDGTATITGIISNNSHIGANNGTLTLDDVTMENIVPINKRDNGVGGHPNLMNYGTLMIKDSNFVTKGTFINNYGGNITIDNTIIDRNDPSSNTLCRNDSDWDGYKNTHVIRNYNNAGGIITIKDSEINHSNNGEVIDNAAEINIKDSTLTAGNNNAINSSSGIVNVENSDITAKNITLNLTSTTASIKKNSSIISNTSQAIGISSSSTLNLGELISEDGAVSQTYPLIKGETYGISNSNSTINFYDGIIKGRTNRVNGVINNIEPGYMIIDDTDGNYKTNYLDKVPIVQNITQATAQDEKKYYDLKTAFGEALNGDTLKMISNYSNLPDDLTAVNNHNVTFDLNGKFIRQSNDVLMTNDGTLTIVDSSQNKNGEIIALLGSKSFDNNGTLILNGGTFTDENRILLFKNNNGATMTIDGIVNIKSTVNVQLLDQKALLIDNDGTLNIYNGAYLSTIYSGLIRNKSILNVVDLNRDDDENTTSSLPAPVIYNTNPPAYYAYGAWNAYIRHVRFDQAAIYNTAGATANIYGGVFNNGETYETGTPNYAGPIYNLGTASFKNFDNYSFLIGYNNGTMNIQDSYLHNLRSQGIYNDANGTVTISDSTIDVTAAESTDSYENIPIYSEGSILLDNVTISNRIGTDNKAFLYNSGTVTIKDSTVNNVTIYNRRTVNLQGTTMNNIMYPLYNNYPISSEAILNIDNTSIQSTNVAITNGSTATTINLTNNSSIIATGNNAINSAGVVNVAATTSVISQNGVGINLIDNAVLTIGEKGGVPDITDPYVEGTTFGVYRNLNSQHEHATIFNFYDGLIVGQTGTTAISGGVTDVESGYMTESVPLTDSDTGITKYNEYLVVSSSVVEIARVGIYSFASNDEISPSQALQNAINHAIGDGSNVQAVELVTDVDLTNDEYSLTASMPVTINLNGHDITYDSTYTIGSNITLNGNNLGGNLSKLLGDVFDVNSNPKNILVYELSDGSKLDTSKIYTLYRDGKVVGLEKQELGRYSYKGNNEELTAVRGRLYLNNLNKGSYKLVSNDNKSIEFSIDSDGNISGNVTDVKEDSSSNTSISEAELILQIQTGITRHYYLLLIIPIILIIITLMIIIRKIKILKV